MYCSWIGKELTRVDWPSASNLRHAPPAMKAKSSEKTIVYSQRASPPKLMALQSTVAVNVRVAGSHTGTLKGLRAGGFSPLASFHDDGAFSYEI